MSNFTVSNLNDSGAGSLRAAITGANTPVQSRPDRSVRPWAYASSWRAVTLPTPFRLAARAPWRSICRPNGPLGEFSQP